MTEPGSGQRSRWMLLVVIALGILALDQTSKFYAVKDLTTAMADAHATTLPQEVRVWAAGHHLMNDALGPNEVRPLVRSFWSWHYAENEGAAFSFAANWPQHVRVPFFFVVSLAAIGLIGFYYRRLRNDQTLLRVALAFVMGGAIGNLADRIIRGYVIDFIDWHLNDPLWQHPNLHWATFNVADAGISVGVALIALDSIVSWAISKRTPKTANAAPSNDKGTERREAGRA